MNITITFEGEARDQLQAVFCGVDPKESREYLTAPYFDTKSEAIIGTNGHTLIHYDYVSRNNNGFLVDSTDYIGILSEISPFQFPVFKILRSTDRVDMELKLSESGTGHTVEAITVKHYKKGGLIKSENLILPDHGLNFPDWKKVIPNKPRTEPRKKLQFGLHIEYIASVAKVLCSDPIIDTAINLTELGDYPALKVCYIGYPDLYQFVMPILP